MEKLDKELRKYFACLYEHVATCEAISAKAGRPLTALKNQCEQLRLCERVEGEDVALFAIPNLKANLISKIKCALEAELALVNDTVTELEESTTKLSASHDAVLKCTERMALRPGFVEGSAACPSRSDLVDWADDATMYHRVRLMRLKRAVARLDYLEEDSVVALAQAFSDDKALRRHVDTITETSKWFALPQEVA